MMKRTIVLLWVALATMAVMAQSAGWSAGAGTLYDPYQITHAQELQTLAKKVNAGNSFSGTYFKLTTDLNLSDVAADGWAPIGIDGTDGFGGIFDGDNHVITGLTIDGKTNKQGLFGYVNGGTVCRVVIRGATVRLGADYSSGSPLVGLLKNGVIEDCTVEDVTLSGNYSCNMGMIVGNIHTSRVAGCSVTGGTVKGGVHKGAIVGYRAGKSSLQNNFYTDVKGVEGGCDGKDINNTRNPEGAIRGKKVAAAPVAEAEPTVQPMPTLAAKQPVATAAVTQQAPVSSTPVSTQTIKTLAQTVQARKPINTEYIVKTKGVKKTAAKVQTATGGKKEAEPTDFMGKNFRFYTMCDWREGMRFMVVPEKYDLLVNTFRDAQTNKEVGNGFLRHHILAYKGHETAPNGRNRVLFTCEENGKDYYYELPYGSFEDYCYSRKGVPTLAYLGDVDKARELLLDQPLLTRSQHYRVDTDYDSDGFKEVTVEKNKVVYVKNVGVGTRDFPVKIIVEDENGQQFFQNVAMSKTNCSLRDDEFIMDNEKFLFQNSFEYTGATMVISDNISDYIGKTVHTNHPTTMKSKGSGKMRDVKVPRFTGFIIDEIDPIRNSTYYTLTMREVESRRVYTKDVAFSEADVDNERHGTIENDFFGYVFGMGEGATKETSKESRAAIREGRVIPGMSKEEVEMAMGEAIQRVVEGDGTERWMYSRSNGVILDVWFNKDTETVKKAKARLSAEEAKKRATAAKKKPASRKKMSANNDETYAGGAHTTGTPLE